MAENKVNKSEFVRGVLRDVGALTANPPEGWRKKVEDALSKKGLTMNPVAIYGIRTKAMKGDKQARKRGPSKSVKGDDITLNQMAEVRSFSDKFGGIDSLSDIIDAIKSFG